jgi:Mn-dependent DtxR family transcriptional regulator
MNHNVWKSFAANEVSHSMAHYLTTIQDLRERRGYARVSDVAKELEVTKGSVSVQMKHLKEKGFVTEDDNRFLTLTALGETTAREVRYAREVLIQFIQNVLGIKAAQAEADACKIEHLLSPETTRKLLGLVGVLLSGDPDAKKFLRKFSGFQTRCPSLGECRLCEDQCLLEVEPAGCLSLAHARAPREK